MKKMISALVLTCMILTGVSAYTYAEDIDAQIEAIENVIADLEKQLADLKAQKAQNEAGVSNVDEPYVETDRIINIYDSYGDTEYEAIIEITNTSSDPLYLDNASIDLEDPDGHLLQTDDYISTAPSVVKPGEKGYFYTQFGNEISSDLDPNSIVFVPKYRVKKAKEVPHEYPLSDVSLKEDDWGTAVIGRVLNDTDEEDELVYIHVLFYNAEGKIIGISGVNVMDMEPGNYTSFEISSMFNHEMMENETIADYKVIAQETYFQF